MYAHTVNTALTATETFKKAFIIRARILSVTIMLVLCLSDRDLWAAEWLWADDHAIGSIFPDFSVIDTRNAVTPVQDLYGKKGLLLYFNRSTEW